MLLYSPEGKSGDSKHYSELLCGTAVVVHQVSAIRLVHNSMGRMTQRSYEMHPAFFEQGLNGIIARDIQIILAKLSCLSPAAVCTAENLVPTCLSTSLTVSHSKSASLSDSQCNSELTWWLHHASLSISMHARSRHAHAMTHHIHSSKAIQQESVSLRLSKCRSPTLSCSSPHNLCQPALCRTRACLGQAQESCHP